MGMSGFICQDSYIPKIAKFTDEEVGRLFRALMKYHATGEINELGDRESIAFDFIRGDIDQAEEAYSRKCEQAKANRNGRKQTLTGVNGGQRALTAVNGGQQRSTGVDGRDQYNLIKSNINNNKREKEKGKERLQTGFDMFWAAYPKKKAKQDALKAFVKLAPDEGLLDQMMTALGRQKQSNDWMREGGQFIPYPATWLNGRRWEDEAKPQGRVYDDPKPTVAAQRYEQRDYSDREQQLMQRMINGFVEEEDDSG